MQLGVPLNGVAYDATTAGRWLYGRTNGIFSSDEDLIATPGGGMSVIVSAGAAWLTPDRFLGITYTNDEPVTLTSGLAPQVLPRIDRIVVRWEMTALGVHPYLAIKQGTAASSPIAPTVTRSATVWELGIHDIRINPGTLQITASMIQDKRLDETVCGIAVSSIEKIPTQQLYDSWWAWFNELQIDAEEKAALFVEWIELFKSTNETAWNQWYSAFISSSSSIFADWYNAFISNSELTFNAWFADLQNTLDENQASNLFNKIDQHERTGIDSSLDGVHNLRLNEGKFQVFVGIGWATLATVPVGFTGAFFNAQNFIGQSFNLRQFTGYSFNNVIRVEVD